jgi:hypothetical protein
MFTFFFLLAWYYFAILNSFFIYDLLSQRHEAEAEANIQQFNVTIDFKCSVDRIILFF